MTDNLETLKLELKKATIKELSDCIRAINTEAIQHGRLLVSGKKDELVYRLARFIDNTISGGSSNTAAIVIRTVNRTVPRKFSLSLKDGIIESNSTTTAARRQIPIEEISFKRSPFFRPTARLGTIKMCPASAHVRQSKSFQYTLTEEQRNLLATPNASDGRPPYETRFYCARFTGSYENLVTEFPSVCELTVNNNTIQGSSLRCIKGKPGTVHPADISKMTRKEAANNVELVYINNDFPYIAGVYMVERTTVDQLIENLKATKVLSKSEVLEKLQETQEDADIIMESVALQTRDPLALTRITTPIRSKKCTHLQCFDASVFLTMNEQTPTWMCPVCYRQIDDWEELIVDEYFMDMLETTPKHITSVRVEPNGNITLVEQTNGDNNNSDDDEQDEDEQPLSQVKEEEVETILLDDDEDDLLSSSQQSIPNNIRNQLDTGDEDGTIIPNTNSTKRQNSDATDEEIQGHETMVGGRQKKQKAKATVIDLTLDSDDEEPPSTVPETRNSSQNETLILPHLQTMYSNNNPPRLPSPYQ